MIRSFIATDVSLRREGLLHICTEKRGILVTGTAMHGDGVISSCRPGHPDVLLLDITLPGQATAALIRRLRQRGCEAGILLFGDFTPEKAASVQRLRPDALISTYDDAEEFIRAVHSVNDHIPYISTHITKLLAQIPVDVPSPVHDVAYILTPTELQIFRALMQNQTSHQIAQSMFISYRTVQKHRANMARKLHLEGSNALLAFALRHAEAEW